jgi:hypothetical protein
LDGLGIKSRIRAVGAARSMAELSIGVGRGTMRANAFLIGTNGAACRLGQQHRQGHGECRGGSQAVVKRFAHAGIAWSLAEQGKQK